jgi:hypothetical protein
MAMNEHCSDKLFFSAGTGSRLSNSFTKMLRIIRVINPSIKDQKLSRPEIGLHI